MCFFQLIFTVAMQINLRLLTYPVQTLAFIRSMCYDQHDMVSAFERTGDYYGHSAVSTTGKMACGTSAIFVFIRLFPPS